MTFRIVERHTVPPQMFWLHGKPAQNVEHDAATGTWNVHGYPEIQEVFADPARYSSNVSRLMPEATRTVADFDLETSLIQLNPPEHGKLRKLVSKAFTPGVVADLEPRIVEITHALLDEAVQGGRVELVSDLGYPLPVMVIAELLGVPGSDRDLFKKWVDAMFEHSNNVSWTDSAEEGRDALEEKGIRPLAEYLHQHVAERRTRPREDLLTKLVEAEVDGERLPDNQVVMFAHLLLIAGHVTTTALLGNTVLCLDAYPEEQAAVRADRSMVPGAIEESLRLLPPFSSLVRSTTREVDLGGETIPADRLLTLWLGSANRDPRTFANPDDFIPHRAPNPHLSFGHGIHFCLGAPLARLEGRLTLNILLDRFGELRVDHGESLEFSPAITGVQSLPLTLET